MKSLLIRLMPAALLCLALTACGGGGAVGQTPYDPETAAQALLDSGAFSDALDTVDQDTAAAGGQGSRPEGCAGELPARRGLQAGQRHCGAAGQLRPAGRGRRC